MDGSIDSSATQKTGIGGVDDSLRVLLRDIPSLEGNGGILLQGKIDARPNPSETPRVSL